MSSPTEIRAVLLDVGGTLWPERFAPIANRDTFLLARLCATLPSLSRVQATGLLAAFDMRAAWLSIGPAQDTDAVVRGCAESVDVALSADEAIRLRRALCIPIVGHVEPLPGATELLRDIKRRGMRSVLVSNAITRDGETYLKDFEGFRAAESIDAVVSSVDVGYRKPHPAIFASALAAAQCPADQCVMVGNSEVNDIEPADDLGMRTVRVCIEELPPAQSRADAVVTSLREVAMILDKWCG